MMPHKRVCATMFLVGSAVATIAVISAAQGQMKKEEVVVAEGVTYALNGGSIKSAGKVSITARTLDTNERFSITSDENGRFKFALPVKQETAVMFVFEKKGLYPCTVTAILGRETSKIHAVLIQDLPAARAVARELRRVQEQYKKAE